MSNHLNASHAAHDDAGIGNAAGAPSPTANQKDPDGGPGARIRRLEQIVTEQELLMRAARAARAAANFPPSPGPENKIGARRDGVFKAVSSAPSFNWTPLGAAMVALPYTTFSDLAGSLGVAGNVRFNGQPAYTLDSFQPTGKGDEAGSGGGVRSGTVNGVVTPSTASTTVRAGGKRVVRDGDANTMNGGNNPGTYVTTMRPSSSAPKDARKTSNPPIKLETPEEKSAFARWLEQAEERLHQAGEHPFEAVMGAGKSVINILPDLAEAMAKGGVEQQAMDMDEAASLQLILGRSHEARMLVEGAAATRKAGEEIVVPKMAMSNAAQEGGDLVATALQLFAGGAGLVRGAVKGIAAVAGEGQVVKGVAAVDAVKPATLAIGPASDGVHVAMNASGKIAESAMADSGSVINPGFHPVRIDSGPRTIVARDAVNLAEFKRLNVIDSDVGRMRSGEAGAAAELQNYLKSNLERAAPSTPGDFVFTSGLNAGKTVDFMLTPDTVAQAGKINSFFGKNISGFSDQLSLHLNKADFVPMDTRFLTTSNQNLLMDVIDKQPKHLQSKIILFR